MTGGEGPSNRKSIEIIDENGASLGPELQLDFSNHCATKFNETHAILTGGEINKRGTSIINLENSNTRRISLNVERNAHACSRLSHPNGTNYIIVAGGLKNYYSKDDSTEILDVNNIDRGWYQGKIKIRMRIWNCLNNVHILSNYLCL